MLQRQVRATGRVEHVDDADADAYWHARPRPSRISAWASAQSRPIASRAELDARGDAMAAALRRRRGAAPAVLGRLPVVVDELELWQHRDDRFHDRLRYSRVADAGWRLERLQP